MLGRLACMIAAAGVALFACTSGGEATTAPDPPGTTSRVIGANGGTVEADGILLTFPPRAVGRDETIRITVSDERAPSDVTPYSRVYRFEPEGLRFVNPVTVRIAVAGDTPDATLFWTLPGSSTEYEEVGGSVDSGFLVSGTTHFSRGFVGRRKPGPDAGSTGGGPSDAGGCSTDTQCAVPNGQGACCLDRATSIGTCRDLWSDNRNCGSCGFVCAAGQRCRYAMGTGTQGGRCVACQLSGQLCEANGLCCAGSCTGGYCP
jgi:hypothetical protein